MTPQTKSEENKYKNGLSPIRFVLFIVGPMLAVIGWQTLVLIDYGLQLREIKTSIQRIDVHMERPWHDTAGISITRIEGEQRALRERVIEIRRELNAYRGYNAPYQNRPQE